MLLTEKQKELIKTQINNELIKRGINVELNLVEKEKDDGRSRIELTSTNFQTYPVLYKELSVISFSTTVSKEKEDDNNIIYCWIGVSVAVESFNGGSNAVRMFDYKIKFYDNDFSIYEIK
jgi:hypothetical protein